MKTKLSEIAFETTHGEVTLDTLTDDDWSFIKAASKEIDSKCEVQRISCAFMLWLMNYDFMHTTIDKNNETMN